MLLLPTFSSSSICHWISRQNKASPSSWPTKSKLTFNFFLFSMRKDFEPLSYENGHQAFSYFRTDQSFSCSKSWKNCWLGWLVNPVVLASARAHKFNSPISSSFDFHSMIVENILHFTCQYSTMETTNLFLTDIKSVCAAWSTVFYYSFFRLGQPTAKTIPSPPVLVIRFGLILAVRLLSVDTILFDQAYR